jgi:hypothetical protein
MRGLAVTEDVVCLWAEEGPACDAVSTVPPRREGCGDGGRGAVTSVVVVEVENEVVVVVMQQLRPCGEVWWYGS